VCLTALIAALGLVPFLFASGPGAEIQRPLAIVVIGGLFSATTLTLLLLPILYQRFIGIAKPSQTPGGLGHSPSNVTARDHAAIG
jgi:cobalt-zinc-cadmium resistance protein CzcA